MQYNPNPVSSMMSCAPVKQVAATEADVKQAQQRLAAVRAQERDLKTDEAQLLEQHTALTQRHAELEKQAQQREAASVESQKQHDEVQHCQWMICFVMITSGATLVGPVHTADTLVLCQTGFCFAVGKTS